MRAGLGRARAQHADLQLGLPSPPLAANQVWRECLSVFCMQCHASLCCGHAHSPTLFVGVAVLTDSPVLRLRSGAPVHNYGQLWGTTVGRAARIDTVVNHRGGVITTDDARRLFAKNFVQGALLALVSSAPMQPPRAWRSRVTGLTLCCVLAQRTEARRWCRFGSSPANSM